MPLDGTEKFTQVLLKFAGERGDRLAIWHRLNGQHDGKAYLCNLARMRGEDFVPFGELRALAKPRQEQCL